MLVYSPHIPSSILSPMHHHNLMLLFHYSPYNPLYHNVLSTLFEISFASGHWLNLWPCGYFKWNTYIYNSNIISTYKRKYVKFVFLCVSSSLSKIVCSSTHLTVKCTLLFHMNWNKGYFRILIFTTSTDKIYQDLQKSSRTHIFQKLLSTVSYICIVVSTKMHNQLLV